MRSQISRGWRASVAVSAIALAACLASPASAKVLAKVDGLEITDDDVKVALEDLGATMPREMGDDEREKYALDYLIDLKLVAKKAAADNMGVGPEIVRKLNYYKDKVMMESLLGDIARAGSTEAAKRKVYDDAAKNQKPEPEVSARHILVPTENEAKDVLKRVKGGEDFAKVATEVSKDPGSQGGDLGWFTKDKMVPEFAEAAFKLDKGQISDPVKSQFGWHIIKLEDKRTKEFPPYEAVKDQVARYVAQKAQTDLILQLRQAAKIEKTEAPPPPGMPQIPGFPPRPR